MSLTISAAFKHDINVYLVDSFTKGGLGGNPAGVVLGPPNLSAVQKTYIAQQVGFSETAFVYANNTTDFLVEFFTPQGEVDFCGHATLAAFYMLASQGIIAAGCYTQQTKAGTLHVTINENQIVMDQTPPQFRAAPEVEKVAQALGVPSSVITNTGMPIEIISTGLPDILVPVQTGYLDRLIPDFAAISKLSQEYKTIGFHVFELSDEDTMLAHCRNFAPLYGIKEESATGSASGALGCYLVSNGITDKTSFFLEQGRAMGTLSLLQVIIDTEQHLIHRVRVGGKASLTGTKTVTVNLYKMDDLLLSAAWERHLSTLPILSKQ